MQNTRNLAKKIIAACTIAVSLLAVPANAEAPIVLEYFGQNDCKDDPDMQKRLYEIVRKRGDVIFLNCRVLYSTQFEKKLSKEEQIIELEEIKRRNIEEHGVPTYFNDFCSKRAEEYGQNIKELVHLAVTSMVNGRWVASYYDVMPAVKLGATDSVKEIEMQREGDVLHVIVPEDMPLPKGGKGTLLLFAYAPSTGLSVGEVLDIPEEVERRQKYIDHALDNHRRLVPLDKDTVQDEVESGASLGGEAETAEEFEKKLAAKRKIEKEMKELFFRPVAAMEKIGDWDGSKAQYDISLSTIALKAEIDIEKMGYVVLLQEGRGRAGPIVGAGEIIPPSEKMPLTSVAVGE